ncbi:unnamed protein product [Urochloa humidicola]
MRPKAQGSREALGSTEAVLPHLPDINLGLSLIAVIPIRSSSSPSVVDLHDPNWQGCGHLTRQSAQCTM